MKTRSMILCMVFIFCVSSFLSAQSNLILWNKLGSTTEVQNSEVGPDFDYINGVKGYGPVQHGNGVEANYANACGVHRTNAVNMGPMNAGTIEYWYLSNSEEPDREAMYFPSINTKDFSQYVSIGLYWDAGYNGGYGLLMSWNDGVNWGKIQTGVVGEGNITFSTSTPTHLSFVWDWNGIEGTADTMRVYRDGVLLINGQDIVSNWINSKTNYCIWGIGDYRPGWATAPNGKIDNLKIYNYAKTDFSDRFIEGTNGNAPPSITITEPNGVGDNADTTYTITWNDFDPDDDAQISLYYNTIPTNIGGTLIINGISEDADSTNGSHVWNTTAVPDGSYYVYAMIDDGVNPAVYAYSLNQVTIVHAVASSNLIFWNKLGSDFEVQNSEVGPDGTSYGAPAYGAAQFGNGIHCDNNGEYSEFIFNPATPYSLERGTVEFWIKTDFAVVNGVPQTPVGKALFYINTNQNTNYRRMYMCIHPTYKILAQFGQVSGANQVTATDNTSDWNAGDLVHIAVAWDKDTFDGGKTIAIYINGNQTASTTVPLPVGIPVNFDLLCAGNIVLGAQRPSQSIMDNFKIYNYAKTDFSDRFTEGTNAAPPATNQPNIPTKLKATAGRDVVNMVWTLSTSTGVSNYNICRSLLSAFQISPDKLIGQVTGDKNTYHDRGLTADTIYYYIVTAISSNGAESDPSNEAWARPGTKQHNLLLHNNKINPNRGEKVEVKYTVEQASRVKVKVFNVKGKLVYEYPEQYLSAGEYQVQWAGVSKNAKVVSSGVYVIQLFINGELKDTKKALVVK